MYKEEKDPGIGVRYKLETKRVINKDGSFNVIKRGKNLPLPGLYAFLIAKSWMQIFGLILLFYIILNVFFATCYLLIGVGNLSGAPQSGIVDQFLYSYFFSVQTLTTVGYGAASPTGIAANLLASFEAMIGLISFAFATGLLYGRFSRPNAKLLFSDNIVLAPYQEGKAIMFRVMNARRNVLMDLEISVLLSYLDKKEKGWNRKFFRLNLETSSIQFLPLSWTVVHPIDEDSPLKDISIDYLKEHEGELMISLKAFDDSFSQQVHRRYSYTFDELVENVTFKRPYFVDEEGNIVLDADLLNVLNTQN